MQVRYWHRDRWSLKVHILFFLFPLLNIKEKPNSLGISSDQWGSVSPKGGMWVIQCRGQTWWTPYSWDDFKTSGWQRQHKLCENQFQENPCQGITDVKWGTGSLAVSWCISSGRALSEAAMGERHSPALSLLTLTRHVKGIYLQSGPPSSSLLWRVPGTYTLF